MIRLMQIVPSLGYAGPPVQMALLSGRLAAEGFDVRVFSLQGHGPLSARLAQRGVQVIELPPRRHASIRRFQWLRQAILDFSPHLIHTWSNAGTGNAGPSPASTASILECGQARKARTGNAELGAAGTASTGNPGRKDGTGNAGPWTASDASGARVEPGNAGNTGTGNAELGHAGDVGTGDARDNASNARTGNAGPGHAGAASRVGGGHNAGTGNANLWGAVAAAQVGVRRVIVSERSVFQPGEWPRPITDRLLIRWARRCVVNSTSVRDVCLQSGWPEERLTVIPNGVERNEHDAVRARARLLNELRLPSNVHLIGAVGPLQSHKRLKDLVWSADQLNLVRNDCCLLIVGQGPHDWRLQRFCNQVVLRGGVFFLGARDDVPEILAGLDCLWIASQSESLPNCVLEAMAAGVPVVASDIPAHRELVTPGETGFLVRVGHRPGYARQTLPMLADESLRLRCGQAAQQRVLQDYAVDTMVERYVRLYRSMVDA